MDGVALEDGDLDRPEHIRRLLVDQRTRADRRLREASTCSSWISPHPSDAG